jgi:Asp-tRNA(Asn)/Glu-tRNA(Gln) amidotransferase A subunit family amidase
MKTPSVIGELFDQIDEIETRFKIHEPSVKAFLPEEGRFERIRKEAESLLSRFPHPELRSALFGSLAGVKDIFHVDGFTTRAGSRLPIEALQGAEAESVRLLKEAGALILGKTVTTEFAYFSPGVTRNPHNLEYTPGGSSSGSAAAVASGLCPLALGTQTIGSIIRPAAFCGVFGLKPTYGRISRAGVIPLSPSLDHIGYFTTGAAAAKSIASCIYLDWKEAIERPGRPMLGIPEGPYLESASELALASFKSTCTALNEAGYEIRQVKALTDFQDIRNRNELILAAEAARVHADWFKKYGELYSSKTKELIVRGQGISESQLAQALKERDAMRVEMNALMESHSIDLWISPAAPGPAPKGLESTGDPVMNLPWTQAGLPTANLPAGKTESGLPLGLQITGRWAHDEALMTWAEGLEQVLSKV